MSGTPRLRSAFPSTPQSTQGNRNYGRAQSVNNGTQASSKPSALPQQVPGTPLIPFELIDAPSQRLFVIGFYGLLTAWRLYDFSSLLFGQADSVWLFMKWVSMDGVFLFGLPALRVPWMEWSSTTMTFVFLMHAIVDSFMIFGIPAPVTAFLATLWQGIYYRETAVSERRVKPATILHNSSLILGKKIIHILPEGSAVLNPDRTPFCIDESRTYVNLPIRVNQTLPVLIELLRIDLETNDRETITISSKETKRLRKQADRQWGSREPSSPRTLQFPVKKTGLYRLKRVIDESHLEVQRRLSDTLVVRCPSALVKHVVQDKCKNELSDFHLQIDATPPFKIKFSKEINRKDHSQSFLTIHPDNFETPLAQPRVPDTLVKFDVEQPPDVSWARSQHVEFPINETLGVSGGWRYSIDEVHDACGNVVNYTNLEESSLYRVSEKSQQEQTFVVHDRPRARLDGCDPQHPIKAARGRSRRLPLNFLSQGSQDVDLAHHHVTYFYTPQKDDDSVLGNAMPALQHFSFKDDRRGPEISEPGMYTLESIFDEFCTGEILEPSSCLLLNPPEPDLVINAESIPDKCAGNSIGLMVDLDFVGTPPFELSYIIHRKGGPTFAKVEQIDRMRAQLELKPTQAGYYSYEFLHIHDSVYGNRSLKHRKLKLETDVKPPAFAHFLDQDLKLEACIDEPVTLGVEFSGEGPWVLEYELIHGGKRKKHRVADINSENYSLLTDQLKSGGKFSLTLTSVTDRFGCKVFLDQEATIDVRHQKPTAAFGLLEGKRTALALEGKKTLIPVRLTGQPPWTVTWSKLSDPAGTTHKIHFSRANDFLETKAEDTYEIHDVRDNGCPGTIEKNARTFEVQWVPRPTIQIMESSSLVRSKDKYVKNAVCEGDQDAMEVSLHGTPPFDVRYKVQARPDRGSSLERKHTETVGLNTASIQMETSYAGLCEYRFSQVGDRLYSAQGSFSHLTMEQRIHALPSANFLNAGKTYSFCKEEDAGDEVIPIALVGRPPFSLEMGIRHHTTLKPEVINIPHIEGNRYDFRIPHHLLGLGTHAVSIRKVKDAHGCQKTTEFDGPIVHVNLVDIPSISPLEPTSDYCVGDFISFTLSGTPPFNIFYAFEGAQRKASTTTTNFRRIAERRGNFTITGVSDKVSTDSCKAKTSITKRIHELPSVRISHGRTAEVDIHEGSETEILFEFGGTPPFEFTYTRSTNAARGKKSVIIETKHDVSHSFSKSILASQEGTYEVVSIRDRYCGFTTQRVLGKRVQQLLTFN